MISCNNIQAALVLLALVALANQHKILSSVADGVTDTAQASTGITDTGLVHQNGFDIHRESIVFSTTLNRLKLKLKEYSERNPGKFYPEDVEKFMKDLGSIGASRFLNQRQNNLERAFGLAKSALEWRNNIKLSKLKASLFPCDLFKMGLIFEHGRAHRLEANGQYVETYPVIWLRLGALGSIIKQLEQFTLSRLMSYGYNTLRNGARKVGRAARKIRRSRRRRVKSEVKARARQPMIKNMSVGEYNTINHVLRAIAWWLEDWINRNPKEAKATLVLDFENTDFAFVSRSVTKFLLNLDDFFPDLFDRIIAFRYKNTYSLHGSISLFNRIYKSRVSSSPETDGKLKYVKKEEQISAYMPRVDTEGSTMLPNYVSGDCNGPDNSIAPPSCRENSAETGLYDQTLWLAIINEFYYSCKAKTRIQ